MYHPTRHPATQSSGSRGWPAVLGLVFGLLTLATPAVAEFLPVTDPTFQITQARPILDTRTQTYLLDVSVANTGRTASPGQYRLVVASANKTALEPLGATAANEPYYGLLTGQGATFAAGAKLKRQLKFSGGRGQLVATLRLEREIPVPPNQPPTASAGPAQSLTLARGQTTLPVTLDAGASADADGSIAEYRWAGVPNPDDVVQPTLNLGVGSYSFSLIVVDNTGAASAPATVSVTVNPPPNEPPTAAATATPAEATLQPGQTQVLVVLDGSGSADPEGLPLTYVWTGTTVNPDDQQTAQVLVPEGSHSFTLVVHDPQGAPSTPVTVTALVNPVLPQHPPQIQVSATTAAVDEGGMLTLSVTASDPDGDVVVLTAAPLIGNASFVATPGPQASGGFSFQPDHSQQGTHVVSFVARDASGLADARSVEVTVNDVNRAPTLGVPQGLSVDEGGLLVIPLTASDPDVDPVTLTAAGVPANALFLPVQGTIQFAPGFDQAGGYAIQVTASDGVAATTATVNLTVNDVPTGGAGPRELILVVDPVETPTLLNTARVTGAVNTASQVTPTALRSALITGLDPATARQGQTLDVLMTGQGGGSYATHFAATLSQASFGIGVGVNQLDVTGPTTARANITIAPDAAPGSRLVSLTTGDETAVSVVAFNLTQGLTQVSGTLVDRDSGLPIIGALVTLQGSGIRATTDAQGGFVLVDVPIGAQTLVVNATNHGLIRMPLEVAANTNVALGPIASTATVFDPQTAPSVSVGSLLLRGIGDGSTSLSIDQAKAVVQDALLLVGGPDIGLVDEYGNQLNPEVGAGVPFAAFGPGTVETLAGRMVATETRTLGELLFEFTALWDWSNGKPVLIDWLNAIQSVVNQAWANRQDRRYALVFLLFNPGRSLSPTPPTITPDMPLNALQASLAELTLLLSASRTIDPEVLHQGVLQTYPELAEVRFPQPPTGLIAALRGPLDTFTSLLVPPAHAADKPVAAAEQAEQKGYVGTRLMLAARRDVNPPGAALGYAWSLVARPIRSTSPELTGEDRRVAFFKPDVSGDYQLRLVVTGDGQVSDPVLVTVTAGDRCDANFEREWHNADATWGEVLCVLGDKLPSAIAGQFVSEGLGDLLKGAFPLDTADAKISAANSLKQFVTTEGFTTPASKIDAAKVFGEHYPAILKEAQQSTTKFTAFKKFAVNQAIQGAAGFIQGQASQVAKDLMYGILDKMLDLYIKSLRPAPPDNVAAELIEMTGFDGRKGVLITFDRSSRDLTGKPVAPGLLSNPNFYYILWRSSPGDLMTRLTIGAEGSAGGPVLLPGETNRLAFLDPNPPEGQDAYYVQSRRIIGAKTVPNEQWSEAGFWIEQFINTASPPGANVYTQTKVFTDRAIAFMKAIKLQDSDLSEPQRLYFPRPFERPAPPAALASTPLFSAYGGDVLLGLPVFNSVYRLLGGRPEYLLNCGFKDPHQVGLAVDSLGYVYADNSASDQLYGGRIFRWKPFDLTRELFGSVQYFSLDLQLSRPASVQSMTAGWLQGADRLFIADAYSDTIRELVIPAAGALPPNTGHHVSQAITAAGEVPIRADTSMAVDPWNAELLVSSGDNLWRYGDIHRDFLFPDVAKPFQNISGVGVDEFGGIYLADSAAGTITAIPNLKRNTSFFLRLVSTPWVRSLYTLIDGLDSPGDLRLIGDQKALVWFDRVGFHQYAFGFSGRLVDANDDPIPGARVSVENRGLVGEVITDQYGVFRLRGLRGPNLSDQVALLIRTREGASGSYRVNLDRVGHTFHERILFVASEVPTQVVTPLPPNPPTPVVVPPTPVVPGETTLVETSVETLNTPVLAPVFEDGVQDVFAPYVEILVPTDGLKTAAASALVKGIVLGAQVTDATLVLNGTGQPLAVNGGGFEVSVPLRDGLNRIQVSIQGLDPNGAPVTAVSPPARVLRSPGDHPGALVGVVTSQADGFPVPAAAVYLPALGLSATTDARGIWRVLDVPVGDIEIEVVP